MMVIDLHDAVLVRRIGMSVIGVLICGISVGMFNTALGVDRSSPR